LSGEDGSAKFGEVVEGVVAGVILDVDFEGAECWGMFFVKSLDCDHAVEHSFELS
jgi:hypothetical protein